MSRTFPSYIFCLISSCIVHSSQAAELGYGDLIQQSLQLRNNGEFVQAEAVLRQALPLAEQSNEASYLLAMVVAFQGRHNDAIRILDDALQTYPDDTQLLLGKAQVLSFQGFYGESIAIIEQSLAQTPDNSAALILLARVYYYQRRYADARAQFSAVLEYDPSNLEALVGRYDVELAAGDTQAANNTLERAQRIAPDHIEVTSRRDRRAVPSDNSAHILTASYGKGNIDLPGFEDWISQNFEYRYRSTSGNQVYLRREHAKRFGLDDTMYEVGGMFSGINSSVELSLARTADDEILPEQRIRLAGNMLLKQAGERIGSTMLGVSLTQSSYATGDVNWLKLDFTHYFLNANAWLTPGVGIVEDEQGEKTVGWNIGAHWQLNAQLLAGYNFTDAPETELNVTTQTYSHHVYFSVNVSDETSLRLDLSRNTRENSYTQETVALSIQHQL